MPALSDAIGIDPRRSGGAAAAARCRRVHQFVLAREHAAAHAARVPVHRRR